MGVVLSGAMLSTHWPQSLLVLCAGLGVTCLLQEARAGHHDIHQHGLQLHSMHA
jgi:hypothetical protein